MRDIREVKTTNMKKKLEVFMIIKENEMIKIFSISTSLKNIFV
jgi:hypothetical protein